MMTHKDSNIGTQSSSQDGLKEMRTSPIRLSWMLWKPHWMTQSGMRKRTEKSSFFVRCARGLPIRRAPRSHIVPQIEVFVKQNLHGNLHKKIPKSLCILPIAIGGGYGILESTKGKEVPR